MPRFHVITTLHEETSHVLEAKTKEEALKIVSAIRVCNLMDNAQFSKSSRHIDAFEITEEANEQP